MKAKLSLQVVKRCRASGQGGGLPNTRAMAINVNHDLVSLSPRLSGDHDSRSDLLTWGIHLVAGLGSHLAGARDFRETQTIRPDDLIWRTKRLLTLASSSFVPQEEREIVDGSGSAASQKRRAQATGGLE
jgi:hypothetical protein